VSENDGEFWWSFEKTAKHEVIRQRSRDKYSVKKNFKETEILAEKLKGKGCRENC
jgi:hypothetical protein